MIERAKEEIIKKIGKLEAKDNKVIKVVEEMKKAEVKVLRNKKGQIENDLMLKGEKIYIPRNNKLRLEIIQLHHNMPIAGYRE